MTLQFLAYNDEMNFDTIIQHLGDYLLINGIGSPILGFSEGKAGISILLFELAQELGDDYYSKYGFEFLQHSLLSKTESVEFFNGLTGIGYTLLYLINNGFIHADFSEMFSEKHKLILEKKIENPHPVDLFYYLEYYRISGVKSRDFDLLIERFLQIRTSTIHIKYVLEQIKKKNVDDNSTDESTELISKIFLNEFYENLSLGIDFERAITRTMNLTPLISNTRKVKILLLDILNKRNQPLKRLSELLMIV